MAMGVMLATVPEPVIAVFAPHHTIRGSTAGVVKQTGTRSVR